MEESSSFEPSFRALARILKVLLHNDSTAKSALAQEARVNYGRLLDHLDWLEERRIVELIVEKRKVIVRLTKRGREFALILLGEDKQ